MIPGDFLVQPPFEFKPWQFSRRQQVKDYKEVQLSVELWDAICRDLCHFTSLRRLVINFFDGRMKMWSLLRISESALSHPLRALPSQTQVVISMSWKKAVSWEDVQDDNGVSRRLLRLTPGSRYFSPRARDETQWDNPPRVGMRSLSKVTRSVTHLSRKLRRKGII